MSVVQHPELQRCVRLQFTDTGLGISAEDQKKLFTEFGRAAEVKQLNIPGTGLGLLITAQLVSLLGGRINVESVHGEGSTFTVFLPLT
ncbi:MAG: ATP-binding protein [Gammaproteobacteria bacterium]